MALPASVTAELHRQGYQHDSWMTHDAELCRLNFARLQGVSSSALLAGCCAGCSPTQEPYGRLIRAACNYDDDSSTEDREASSVVSTART
jgi:hypothetical protein